MRKAAVTLTQPKKRSPVTQADPSKIPVRAGQKIPCAYVFVHYEQGWEYDDVFGHGWIPRLCKVVAKPGCNGVPENGSLPATLQYIATKGGNVIEPTDIRLIEEGATKDDSRWYNYPRYFETQNGKKFWVEPGEEPTVTLGGQVLWDREKQKAVSAAFRAHLRDSGMVTPMHHLTLAHELSKETHRVERLAGRVGMNPHLMEQLKHRQKRLVEMQTAFDEMQTEQLKQGEPIKPKKPGRKLKASHGEVMGNG